MFKNDSVIALANNCLHLRSLGLYYCQNITDRAMYSLAHGESEEQVRNVGIREEQYIEEGLVNLNIDDCDPYSANAQCM
ncbi:F-box protein SKP2B [Camellia lanceoleosa]|uniref:F-box protein SKP2B n=1 Tax=Camellia lanceoleosa TaxID=1840588 RepID=A0ACC0FRP6_9ERIC|nr:F-box protein SKP2B [Camellia lanceoleosa]